MQVHIETEINTPAKKVWEILAHQFGDMAIWTATLSESRTIAANEIPDGFKPAPTAPVPARETTSKVVKAKEIITKYSEDKMTLTFEAADLPPIMASAKNTQRVIPKGSNKCLVSFDIRVESRSIFKLMNPILKHRFGSTMSGVQQELKVYAETGKPVAG